MKQSSTACVTVLRLLIGLHEDRSVRYLIWETFFYFFPLFGLLIVFIRLLALSIQHAVQGPTKDLKNFFAQA